MYIYLPMVIFTIFFLKIQYKANKKRDKRIIFMLTILPSILVATFRYDVGSDYLMYYRMFDVVGNGGEWPTFTGKIMEVGFNYLIIVCHHICSNQWFTFGIIALIIIALIFKTCLDISDNYILSVGLFFVLGIYFDSFNGLRQFLAMSIFFYGIKYMLNKDIKRYLICCAVACLFHNSVLFVTPLYFIQYLKIDLKKAVSISFITLISSSIIYQIVVILLRYTPYSYFLYSEEFTQSIPSDSAILIFSVNTIIGYYFYAQKQTIEPKTQLYFNMHVIFLTAALLTITVPLMSRFVTYGYLIEILYIPSMLRLIRRKKSRQLVGMFIVLFYLVINLYGIYCNGWYDCIPYTVYSNF